MNLEQLKQAVENIERKLDGYDKTYPRDVIKTVTINERAVEEIKVLLTTCQLVLASSGLVEDKKEEECQCDIPISGCGCEVDDWNACNEANRIARARWLAEKSEGLENIVQKCADEYIFNICNARFRSDGLGEHIAKSIRAHFEEKTEVEG